VQTLSSPSSIRSPITSLGVPKKPATFLENPLERPEIGTHGEPPLVNPRTDVSLVSGSRTPQIKDSLNDIRVIPNSEVAPARLPQLWKPEKQEAFAPKKAPSATTQTPVAPTQNKNVGTAAAPLKRRLPDEIKQIFESNSKDFAEYVKNNKKGDEKKSAALLEKTEEKLDKWDRALLLGEYPLERQKPKRIAFVPSSSFVPKKTGAGPISATFPSRIMDTEIASPVHRKESRVPFHPRVNTVPLTASLPVIPKKPAGVPKNTAGVPIAEKKPGVVPPTVIPVKPKQTVVAAIPVPTAPARPLGLPKLEKPPVPPANMSETLVEKIIEGQMRGVFENAPPLLQKELEKVSVREILAPTKENSAGSIENEVWKKRLREYLTKLQGQALSVFSDASAASPTEGEFVLDYVKRIYPILLKAQVMKQ
jgi:hypothetical protein